MPPLPDQIQQRPGHPHQVIAASIDKQNKCRVTYSSGALENPTVNQYVVRYLEGTLPAFMNRDEKYIR